MTPSTETQTGALARDSTRPKFDGETRVATDGGTRAVPDGGTAREDRAPTAAVSSDDVALVTGSTDGIGREIARNLADAGATVLVHGRDRAKAERAVSELPGDGHDYYLADFADLGAVRDLAADVRADVDRLDVLVNNAGTWQGERHLTALPGGDDLELTFVVNHLAPFLLTHLLVDRLAASAQAGDDSADGGDSDGGGSGEDDSDDCEDDRGEDDRVDSDENSDEADPARVVTVASEVHRRAEWDAAAVRGPDGPSGVDAYGLSKLANVLFTYELARRVPDGVVATCCHPGVSPATALDRDGSLLAGVGWRLYGIVGSVLGTTDSPADAAATPTYLAGSPAAADLHGEYVADCEPGRSSEASHDRSAQRDLWERSVEWSALSEDEAARLSA